MEELNRNRGRKRKLQYEDKIGDDKEEEERRRRAVEKEKEERGERIRKAVEKAKRPICTSDNSLRY